MFGMVQMRHKNHVPLIILSDVEHPLMALTSIELIIRQTFESVGIATENILIVKIVRLH